jgi:hypothetical protein
VQAGIFLLASPFLDLVAGQGIQGEANRNLHHGEFSSAVASFAQSAAILRKNPQGGSISTCRSCSNCRQNQTSLAGQPLTVRE